MEAFFISLSTLNINFESFNFKNKNINISVSLDERMEKLFLRLTRINFLAAAGKSFIIALPLYTTGKIIDIITQDEKSE